MFNIFGLFGIVVVCGVLIVTIRKHNPEHAYAISIGCICVTVTYLLSQITGVIAEVTEIAALAQLRNLDSLFKAVGISIIGQVMADVCADYGQSSLSNAIALAGRFAIVIISLPLFKELLSIALQLVQ